MSANKRETRYDEDFKVMFHSDRRNSIYPFDNACCECFFKYLKKEEINRITYHSFQELKLSVFEYIE